MLQRSKHSGFACFFVCSLTFFYMLIVKSKSLANIACVKITQINTLSHVLWAMKYDQGCVVSLLMILIKRKCFEKNMYMYLLHIYI